MKRCFQFLFLLSTFCYSQSEVEIIRKIDSIAKINGQYGILEGSIHSTLETTPSKNKKPKKYFGQGGHSTSIYINYLDEEYFRTLTNEEKRKYFRKFELIKGKNHQSIGYENLYNEDISSEFYYQNNQLFYIKLKIVRDEPNKNDITESFEYSIKDLEQLKPIKSQFLGDILIWAKEKNNEILKFYSDN